MSEAELEKVHAALGKKASSDEELRATFEGNVHAICASLETKANADEMPLIAEQLQQLRTRLETNLQDIQSTLATKSDAHEMLMFTKQLDELRAALRTKVEVSDLPGREPLQALRDSLTAEANTQEVFTKEQFQQLCTALQAKVQVLEVPAANLLDKLYALVKDHEDIRMLSAQLGLRLDCAVGDIAKRISSHGDAIEKLWKTLEEHHEAHSAAFREHKNELRDVMEGKITPLVVPALEDHKTSLDVALSEHRDFIKSSMDAHGARFAAAMEMHRVSTYTALDSTRTSLEQSLSQLTSAHEVLATAFATCQVGQVENKELPQMHVDGAEMKERNGLAESRRRCVSLESSKNTSPTAPKLTASSPPGVLQTVSPRSGLVQRTTSPRPRKQTVSPPPARKQGASSPGAPKPMQSSNLALKQRAPSPLEASTAMPARQNMLQWTSTAMPPTSTRSLAMRRATSPG
eukprot:gnl/TRDRNA2_/TRDRNA2_157319_c4_seq1.p1 gnl/TRDRNA2_/TRDRNA2_157319_c4~~gnl/TRDRNA2_/TRDRNA2_157319_c4_seq1.p1  ORF type:complete len:462 (-),score=79.19 gnl/TRDRNA2_/TRDRNA2_157319_c4_seq1:24-1409(-)